MDNSSDYPGVQAANAAPVRRASALTLVMSPLRLACDGDPMSQAWSTALADLAGFLGIDTAFVPAPDAAAPVFAPWAGWGASAFQNGGCAGLPEAQFVASYCIDHASGGALHRDGVDVMLVSPLPAACDAGEGGLPSIGTLRAMIRAAVDEGRERVAVIGAAHQRSALSALRLAGDRSLCPNDTTIDILAIEDALPALMVPAAPWDAIIAMPDLRSIIFTLLAETSGVRGPWPMLWHNRGLRRVTCETKGKSSVRLPLDAPALIHTLSLTLNAAGKADAALCLHEGWARLRGRGVTTAARGSDAPYATEATDIEFIALLRDNIVPGGQPACGWRALKYKPVIKSGSQMPPLRVISASIAN